MAGADDIQRAGFGCHDPAVAKLAKYQWAHAMWVANTDQHVIGNADKRIGTINLFQRIGQPAGDIGLVRACDEVDDDLGVGGGLEQAAGFDQ